MGYLIMNQIKRRLESIYAGYFTVKELKANELINNGYYQVSRKYRTLARLPNGMTGKQALLTVAKKIRPWDAEKWVDCLGEGSAGEYYLRCHSSKEDQLEIGESLFRVFRFLGGNTYETLYWKDRNKQLIVNKLKNI